MTHSSVFQSLFETTIKSNQIKSNQMKPNQIKSNHIILVGKHNVSSVEQSTVRCCEINASHQKCLTQPTSFSLHYQLKGDSTVFMLPEDTCNITTYHLSCSGRIALFSSYLRTTDFLRFWRKRCVAMSIGLLVRFLTPLTNVSSFDLSLNSPSMSFFPNLL